MELLYKGTRYTREILNSDNSAFANAPYIVLRQRASKAFWAADDVDDISSGTKKVYQFTFSAALTHDMVAGVYDIEVYKDSTMEEMLYYEESFCKAIETAASETADNQPSNN